MAKRRRNTGPRYVWVNKSGVSGAKFHRAKRGWVKWSDGKTRPEWLPACGTRIDVCAIDHAQSAYAGDLCRRCFPKGVDPRR